MQRKTISNTVRAVLVGAVCLATNKLPDLTVKNSVVYAKQTPIIVEKKMDINRNKIIYAFNKRIGEIRISRAGE